MHKQYCGYVSIIGKPNVGKSTLINTMLDKKISITSRKSQTTRNNILGIRTIANKQIIFIDTPGMHIKSQKTMNKVLNKSAQGIIDDSDIILFVLQRLTLGDEDKLILEKSNKTHTILSKCKGSDLVGLKYDQLLKNIQPAHGVEAAFRF